MVDKGAARSRAQALAFRLAPREMDPEVHILLERARALRRAVVLGTLSSEYMQGLWQICKEKGHPGAR
eukprot:1121542-Alexandrium_andersonii.AAC.1